MSVISLFGAAFMIARAVEKQISSHLSCVPPPFPSLFLLIFYAASFITLFVWRQLGSICE
jgi:hypothetical protein